MVVHISALRGSFGNAQLLIQGEYYYGPPTYDGPTYLELRHEYRVVIKGYT